ncbi:MAG: response regulator [Leptolyngbyaceae cyanobacterium CRU_2_3]|nr:response regulator [Leptolyngbyaceae cyanobacterium CRU_2_3]
MNTISMGAYRPSQKLHPLSLLAQLASRQTNGCLQVSSGTVTWSIYLEQGKVVYASNTVDPFGRLDRQLRRLSAQVPSLISAIRVQLRLLFENSSESSLPHGRDYEALCWLVEQQHLTVPQAAGLIENLAKEILESFLLVQMGNYEVIEQDLLGGLPRLCQLDPRPLVEYCQNHLRRRHFTGQAPTAAEQSPTAGQNGTRPTAEKLAPAYSQSTNLTPARPAQPSSESSKATYKIACIDDSPTVLQAIQIFLDDKSFSVIAINDPVKALMQVIRSKPDLILLDVTMPNLDGYELCSLLRKHPNFKNTPIVMVTGNTGFIDRAKAKLVGASSYLTKPFTQSDLIKVVFKLT